jgi:hypothetical protein
MAIKKPLPQRLKKLENSDLLSIKDSNGDFLVVTKQETTKVIKDFIEAQFSNELDEMSRNIATSEKRKLEKIVTDRLNDIEKNIDAFIEHKFTLLSEKICDMLITRKFGEEVNKKAEELLLKKRGQF